MSTDKLDLDLIITHVGTPQDAYQTLRSLGYDNPAIKRFAKAAVSWQKRGTHTRLIWEGVVEHTDGVQNAG